jgi:hypothetical protein
MREVAAAISGESAFLHRVGWWWWYMDYRGSVWCMLDTLENWMGIRLTGLGIEWGIYGIARGRGDS